MKRTKEILMEQMERLAELAEHTEDMIAAYKIQVELAEAMAQLADRVIRCNSISLAAARQSSSPGTEEPRNGTAARTGIGARRKAVGMDQNELADRLGVSRSTVAMWETGASAPRAGMLLALADVLHCTVEELLEVSDGVKDRPQRIG